MGIMVTRPILFATLLLEVFAAPSAESLGYLLQMHYGRRPRGLGKSALSRVIIGVTPDRVLTTLLITYLLSPLDL